MLPLAVEMSALFCVRRHEEKMLECFWGDAASVDSPHARGGPAVVYDGLCVHAPEPGTGCFGGNIVGTV
jgi:hypothetical protein